MISFVDTLIVIKKKKKLNTTTSTHTHIYISLFFIVLFGLIVYVYILFFLIKNFLLTHTFIGCVYCSQRFYPVNVSSLRVTLNFLNKIRVVVRLCKHVFIRLRNVYFFSCLLTDFV